MGIRLRRAEPALAVGCHPVSIPSPETRRNMTSSEERHHGRSLTRAVSVATLQTLQDRFSRLGRVTVCLCSTDCELITVPAWGSRFSELIGTSPKGRAEFADRVCACAGDPRSAATYTCHEGMSLHATRIVYDEAHLATLVVGTRDPIPPARQIVTALAAQYNVDAAELWEGTGQIDPYNGGDPDAIHQFADALAETIATMYGQAEQIRRQLADLQTVHSLAALLAGTSDLQEILDVTVNRVVEVMPVKACAIRILDDATDELILRAVCNLSAEYLRKGPVLVHENAIDTAAFAGEAVHILDAATDPRIRYPEYARREGIVSGLCVPMTYRGKTIGVIRAYTAERYTFTTSEEALLRSLGSNTAAAVINNRLFHEQAETERFQRQVEAAGAIQQRMLPSEPPHHPALAFGCVYNPTLQVGGDFYDFIDLPGSDLGLCVADVVGKGLPAALMMASVRSALRAYANDHHDVHTVVERVNRHMYRDTLIGEFTTLVYGVFSPDGRTFRYCNAGHNPPLLLRGDRFIELRAGGLVIGVLPDERFDDEAVTLEPGDLLTIVTDGVTEAMNFEDTAYGQERLLTSIRKHAALDAGQLAQQLLWDVRRFVGLADQSDDITIVVAKVL